MSFMCHFLCNSMVTFLERTALLGCWFACWLLAILLWVFSVFPLGRTCSGLLYIITCLCLPTDDSIQSFLLPIALIVITLFPCIFFCLSSVFPNSPFLLAMYQLTGCVAHYWPSLWVVLVKKSLCLQTGSWPCAAFQATPQPIPGLTPEGLAFDKFFCTQT